MWLLGEYVLTPVKHWKRCLDIPFLKIGAKNITDLQEPWVHMACVPLPTHPLSLSLSPPYPRYFIPSMPPLALSFSSSLPIYPSIQLSIRPSMHPAINLCLLATHISSFLYFLFRSFANFSIEITIFTLTDR